MKRYTKQRLKNECAPIAIFNALMWANQKVSYKRNIEDLRKRCGIVPGGEGTIVENITKTINKTKVLKLKSVALRFNRTDLNCELRKNRVVILAYDCDIRIDFSHCFLCIGETPKCYKVVNFSSSKRAVEYITKRKMKYILSRTYMAWCVERK